MYMVDKSGANKKLPCKFFFSSSLFLICLLEFSFHFILLDKSRIMDYHFVASGENVLNEVVASDLSYLPI